MDKVEPILLEDLGMHYLTKNSKRKHRLGLYKCGYCGEEFRALTNKVKRGELKSCGCFAKASKTTHGVSRHRLYNTWKDMMRRCTNPKASNYKHYGARGIKVCEGWLDARNFINWAEATHIEGRSLDRIDNDKGYNPENCRWADATTQALNQRIRNTNKSGFVGVSWKIRSYKWVASISIANIKTNLGYFNTLEEAVEARDNYIISNNLPHKLSSEYKEKINEDI